jgi:hypothetical protein
MEPALCQVVKTIILFLERTRDFQISALSKVIFIYPAFPGFRKAAVRPAAAAPGKAAWLTLVVLTRSDWRMLPFRLIVQVTLSNINGTLRVYS